MTGEAKSVSRQVDACRKLIDLRGWTEAHEPRVDNSISAYGGKRRPAWEEVLALITSGEVDVVVAYHLDRITRSMLDLERLIGVCEKNGVAVATATGDIDLTTDTGRMVARILGAVARAEVERKAARQRLANAQLAAEGKPWSGGARPFGYAVDQLHVVEDEALAIKQAAIDVLAGTSLLEIARRWDAAGLKSSRATDETKAGWSGRGVKNLLVSPRYAGLRSYRGEVIGEATWPAIIDLETHLALKAKLTDPSRLNHGHRQGRKAGALLTGIATCAVCGSGLNASSNKGVLTYTCKPKAHVVPNRALLDRAVEQAMVGYLTAPNALALLLPSGDDKVDAASSELEALRGRLAVLGESFVEGAVDDATFKALSRKLRDKIDAAEAELVSVGSGGVLDGLSIGTDHVAEQWKELPIERKRAAIATLLDVEVQQVGKGGRRETSGWSDRDVRIEPKRDLD